MTAREIALVRESYRKMAPLADHVVALYYARLFDLDPALRRLCRGGMEAASRRQVRTIGRVIGRLEHLAVIEASLWQMGRRQARRGVRAEHYALAGTALLWAIEKALGPEFSAELRAAWTRFYDTLAAAMTRAAPAPTPAA